MRADLVATDIDAILANLSAFHDLRGKTIIHVGAGGGQLIRYARDAQSIVAVDPDPAAVDRLETALRESGLTDRFRVVQGEFSSLRAEADLVFFEFCLHEMDDPAEALLHARHTAPEILVLDHLPDSPWAWHTGEEEKAARGWEAARRLPVVREASFKATQRFESYSELHSKLEVLGEQAIARAGRFEGQGQIRIEMGYAMALIRP